jgi:hypothetical protein
MDVIEPVTNEVSVAVARAPLHTTAQVLTFDPGMYVVDFRSAGPARGIAGLALPGARLDALPASDELRGQAVVSVMSPLGWLAQADLPALVRVTGGKAGVMLTIYRTAGTAAPELRVRYVEDGLKPNDLPDDEQRAESATSATPAAAAAPLVATDAFEVLVHAQERGDLRAPAGAWAGKPGGGLPLEGFAIFASAETGLEPADLEYQAVLGEGWNTPWFTAGEFCGSRGLALPILGVRLRLVGRGAEMFACEYAGSFLAAGQVGPVAAGQVCESGGQPMEALRVTILRKAPARRPTEPGRRKRGGPP